MKLEEYNNSKCTLISNKKVTQVSTSFFEIIKNISLLKDDTQTIKIQCSHLNLCDLSSNIVINKLIELRLEDTKLSQTLLELLIRNDLILNLTMVKIRFCEGEKPAQFSSKASKQLLTRQLRTSVDVKDSIISSSFVTSIIENKIAEVSIINCQVPQNILQSLLNSTSMTSLTLSNNNIKEILTFPKSLNLKTLVLSNNQIYGQLSYLKTSTNIIKLDLSNNYISGNLNPIASLAKLEYLNVAHNHLFGNCPETFRDLKVLKVLDISYNSLHGIMSLELIDHLAYLDEIVLFEGNELEIDFESENTVPTSTIDNVIITNFPSNSPSKLPSNSPSNSPVEGFRYIHVKLNTPTDEDKPFIVYNENIVIVTYVFIGILLISIFGIFVFFDKSIILNFSKHTKTQTKVIKRTNLTASSIRSN